MVGGCTADDVEHDDSVALLIDPVADPIGATTCRPATGERGTQRMADPLRVFAKRAVNKLPRGECDGRRQALSQGPLCWWCHEQVVRLVRGHLEVSRLRRASMVSAISSRVAYSPLATAASASARRSRPARSS